MKISKEVRPEHWKTAQDPDGWCKLGCQSTICFKNRMCQFEWI